MSTRARMRMTVACALAVALPSAGAASARAAETTVVTASAQGVLTIQGGDGANGVAVTNRPPTAAPGETQAGTIFIYAAASFRASAPEPPAPVSLADGAGLCQAHSEPMQPPYIGCDAAAIDHIDLDLGAGDDFLLTQDLTHVGGHSSADPESEPAVSARMGAGDDTYAGGNPLGEHVEDGPGTDYASTCCDDGGNDVIVQPDVADPATDDAGDFLDMSYGSGVVDYSARSNGQGIDVTTRDGQPNDGAPGEDDKVMAHGVRGTRYDDEIVGIGGYDFITFAFSGGGGDDTLVSGAGADTLDGGDGNDDLTAGDGADRIDAGAGDDSIAAADDFDDAIVCGAGTDAVVADPLPLDAGDGCENVQRPVADATTPTTGTTTSGGTPPASTSPPAQNTQGDTAPPKPAAPRFQAPKHGRLQVNRKGRVKLAFRCSAESGCAGRRLLLRAKVGKRTYTVKARVKALQHGRRARVAVDLPRRLAQAVRKAGKGGIKATLRVEGARRKRLRLVPAG